MKLLIAIIMTLAALAYTMTPAELVVEQAEADHYAEMVCIGRETDMEYGWPNYKNLNIDCG